MRASDELETVLHTAVTLAAGEPSRQVALTHLAQAVLRSVRDAPLRPGTGQLPTWSPAATRAIDRATQFAASEGGQVTERRHLAAALAEIVTIRNMLAGTGPFIDHLPIRTPEGGITYHLKGTAKGTLSVRERDPEDPG